MRYRYKKALKELDTFVSSQASPQLSWNWGFIKKAMILHAEHFGDAEDTWKAFERTSEYDNSDDCDVGDLIPHACLSMWNMIVPDWAEANFHIEVAFGLARGKTRRMAVNDQYDYLADMGGYEEYYEQSDPRGRTTLTTIKGGRHVRKTS